MRIPREWDAKHRDYRALLCSDIHYDEPDCDRKLLKEDFDWAKSNGADIFIIGDLWSLIIPQDRKRHTASAQNREDAYVDAVVDKAVDDMAKFLEPYASQVRLIGRGNHETSILRHHGTDPVRRLIEKLDCGIVDGGYTGAIVYRFSRKGGNTASWSLWYHHGMGGNAPVSKGLISFARAAAWVRGADALWFGHVHNRYAVDAAVSEIPQYGSEICDRQLWYLMSGAYSGKQNQFDDQGRYKSVWANEKGFAPQGRGGIRLMLSVDRRENGKAVVKANVVL